MDGEHERQHGGRRGPGNDVAHWDRRYADRERLWPAEPNLAVGEIVRPLTPGRALDLGAGEGRHAIWLAQHGWQVTAVDFSAVGIARALALADAVAVEWIVDDVRAWEPPRVGRSTSC